MRSEIQPIPEEILASREGHYFNLYRRFLETNRELIAEYGSWRNVPRKLRNRQFKNLKSSGFIYQKGRWSPPNSIALSSL